MKFAAVKCFSRPLLVSLLLSARGFAADKPAANPAPPPAAPAPKAGTPSASAPRAAAPAAATPAAPLPPPKKADPKLFDEGLQDYFAHRPQDAAPKLYEYLEGTSQTDENFAWGQYFLARSLLDLGFRHAAGTYLARVARERGNPNVVPKALEALRSLVDVPHDETMIDEQVFGALDLGFLQGPAGDFAHFQQGMVDLRVGNERWAQTQFSKLTESTAEASRAKFAVVVTRLRTSKDVSDEVVSDFLELSKDEKLSLDTRNEARLAVARLRYERKDYTGALEAFKMVQLPALDPGRASLYLEEAWTRYQLGDLRSAMGLLTTLDAPTFRDEFLPDKYLLRAFVFRDLCHYLPAKRAAKELTRRFAESLEAIHEREDLTKDARLRRAAESHGATQRAHKFLESLELEGERLGRYSGAFGARLTAQLTKIYDLEHAEALRVYDAQIQEGVRAEADKLLHAAEQVRLMEYEVGLKLYERIKKGSKVVIPLEEENLSPAQVAFRFGGEYWNDELRDYRVSLKSRCIEEGTP